MRHGPAGGISTTSPLAIIRTSLPSNYLPLTMYVLFFSGVDPKRLYRRKGGGGGGKGGGGGSRSSSSGSKGSSSSSNPTINFGGTLKTATLGGQGGGKSTVIPAGFPFAGRAAGGGARSEVLGNR